MRSAKILFRDQFLFISLRCGVELQENPLVGGSRGAAGSVLRTSEIRTEEERAAHCD